MMNNNKKDYLIAVVAGVLTVIFVLPTLRNIKFDGMPLFLGLLFAVPSLWVFGLWLGKFLSKWAPVMYQIAKYIVVGFLNTSIDFGVLNFLSIISGLTTGFLIGGVNVPGFLLAFTNSYFWNKFWVFKKDGEALKAEYKDFFAFVLVAIGGIFINSGVVVLTTTYIDPLGGLSPERWLNIAKVVATVFSLTWNFLGYKFFVFKK